MTEDNLRTREGMRKGGCKDHLVLPRPGIRRVPTDPTPPVHPPILMVEPATEALCDNSFWFLFSFSFSNLVVVEVWRVVETQSPH